MGILENFENAWDIDLQYESSGLKVYSEICSNGCSCQTSNDHKPAN